MPLLRNEIFEIVDLAAVEELHPLMGPDTLDYEYPPSDDAWRTIEAIISSDYVLRVITEATELVSPLSFLLFLISAWPCSE